MTELQTKKTPTRQQLTPPAGVKAACKTGIKMVEEGMGGSGLEPATVREARAIVRGTPITVAKAKKMVRWWGRNARFLTYDKDSPAWVAALLWGGRAGLSWSRKLKRTFDAEDKAAQGSVSSGDFVSWTTRKGRYVGKVERVQTSGSISVATSEGGSEKVEVSSDNQVAIVRVYVDNEDSTFSRSNRTVPVKVSMLRVRQEPKIKASAAVKKTLKQKADDHNKKVGNAKSKRTNVRTLSAVFDRGVGAYQTNPQSVRPTVNSAEQWAYARVNSFLYVLRNGRFRGGKHDTDLLPSGHPQSSKKEANPSRTITSTSEDMTHEISIDDATIVGDNDFESKAGKSMPVEIHYRIITPFKVDKTIQEKESDDVKIRGAVYVGGDDMLDRHGELVDSKAIMDAWEKYSKNPVILYNHSKTYGVIGRMTDVSMEEQDGVKMPMGTAIIDGGEKDITRKIRKGMLKAFSIGFIAKAAVKECKDDDSCYMKFTEIDWVETSVVDVPASPDALFSVQKSVMLGVEANMEDCDCGDDCCDEKDAESKIKKLDFDTTEKHIVRIEEDDQYITVVYGKSEEWEGIDVDTTDAPEEAGYYDEDDDKKMIFDVLAKLDAIESRLESDESVNSHLESSKGLMNSEDMDIITEDAAATEEESVVVETPELTEEVVETTEEMMEEKSVEEEVAMPSPREALIDVASALKSIMETLESMQEKSQEVVEEEIDNSEDEITNLKAEIAALKEEKAAREAAEKLEAEVAKRVEERLAEVGVEATPSRKSIPTVSEKKTVAKTFDPQPNVSKGMNGLAVWLESNIAHRN